MTTKKKRFGTLSVVGQGISSVLRSMDSATDGLNIEQLPLDRIDPDPDNPRKLGLNRETFALYANGHPVPDTLQMTWNALQELAVSIKQIGVQQAIKCYRYGDRFRIAFGERRFYATILAGRETIPAWILDEKPRLLRRIQYAENVLREDLTPWERVSNVMALIEEYKREEGKDLTSRALAELLGISHTQANSYLSIIRGPADVQQWLKTGTVTAIETAANLARIENPQKRDTAVNALKQGRDPKEIFDSLKGKPSDERHSDTHDSHDHLLVSARGRPKTHVYLGRTNNTNVVRKLIAGVLGEAAVPDIDWTDLGAVSRLWASFLDSLEKGTD
ncbi:ParB/RepB/Spo0J family partition protein [Methylocaldum sp.]|uniref:ParB/RepB/Spo0J family partition protein n=1 Tax=unclassified Methylocaldum TaxID=2622260 RepID=UPI000A326B8B|nr:ParB/RepB/Spo0J family partition protein [Methylocaldum sp. RMAD-M]